LCLLWLLSTGLAYFLAVGFANDSYDQALVNSADSVVARLRYDGKNVYADLPQAAQDILRHHDLDKFYFQVISKEGVRISGDAHLPGPFLKLDAKQPFFRYAKMDGQDLRIARVRADVKGFPEKQVLVQVAETLHSRHRLANQILISIILPQVFLILLGAVAVAQSVSRSLKPLESLQEALAKRSPRDLSPVGHNDIPMEVRPLVSAINDLLTRLRNDLETQNRFVANAAHQFRTPLAGLKTYIYYAKKLLTGEDAADDPEMRKKQIDTVLDQIDSGTDRMTHLANKLLALAKADPAISTARFEPVDLNFIVSEITSELIGEALKKNLDLEFLGSEHPAIIKGDPLNLTELAENLIENAVLYTEPGGKILVTIVASGHVLLAVQDNGPGIPADERARVFERFYRALGTDVPGSGLGLPIVKEIATAHNAEVLITSGPSGVGTTVAVTFPAVEQNTLSA
jgi:two-component system sensor histidine kinase TctE